MLPLFLAACRSTPTEPPFEPRDHLVLVVIDTLRADAVERATTPVLDGLAANGQRAGTAWSSSTWTVPSMASLFTGMSVRQHGWNREPGNVRTFPRLPPAPMLAEILRDKGYRTSGYYANAFVDPELGFERGFQTYRKTHDTQMVTAVRQEVQGWDPVERHFLYVHLLGPHSPLAPSDAARERYGVSRDWFGDGERLLIGRAKRDQEPGVRDAYREAYHAVVEDTDARLGEILDALGDFRDDALIVVTSDHGELLGEHGFFGHGWWVWDELAAVPLVVEGGRPLPERMSGAALPDYLTRSLSLDVTWPTPFDSGALITQRRDKLAIAVGSDKAIWTGEAGEMYDLATDPDEASPGPVSAALEAARTAWEATPAGTYTEERVTLHPDTTRQLEALGYLD